MSLVSLDDSFFDHPKAMDAGEDAADVFVRGLAYCRRYNTKGKIPKSALPAVTRRRKALECAASLVRVVLWHDEGDHWLVHDYETWYANDAEAKLAKARKLAASRAKNYRDGRRDEMPPITPPSRDASRDASVTVMPSSRNVTHDEPSHARGRVPNSDSDAESPSSPPDGGASERADGPPDRWVVIGWVDLHSGGAVDTFVRGSIETEFAAFVRDAWKGGIREASWIAFAQHARATGSPCSLRDLMGAPDAEGKRTGYFLTNRIREAERWAASQAKRVVSIAAASPQPTSPRASAGAIAAALAQAKGAANG